MTENGRFVRTGWLIALLTTAVILLLSAWGRSVERRIDDKMDKADAGFFNARLDRIENKLDKILEDQHDQSSRR